MDCSRYSANEHDTEVITKPSKEPQMYPHTEVKIIADTFYRTSLMESPRLTTFVLTYPRFIHAEFMTHRVFSRNAQSTRAIPTKKRIERVRNDPVMPVRWGANQRGMQAKDEDLANAGFLDRAWRQGAVDAADLAEYLSENNLHKQWAGRGLETYDTITVICTATDYTNFFHLRCADNAQPEIADLAWRMADAYYGQTPVEIDEFGWHLPFVDDRIMLEVAKLPNESQEEFERNLCLVSAAKCARVSYLSHEGNTKSVEEEIAFAEWLDEHKHMTPFEHQAQATMPEPGQFSNLRKWVQFRKTLTNEAAAEFDYEARRREFFGERH